MHCKEQSDPILRKKYPVAKNEMTANSLTSHTGKQVGLLFPNDATVRKHQIMPVHLEWLFILDGNTRRLVP